MSELKVNKVELQKKVNEMFALKTAIQNYNAEISFDVSRGKSIKGIEMIMEQVLRMKAVIEELVSNTENALQYTHDTFNEMDNSLGEDFSILGEDK